MDCGPTCLRMVAKYYGKHYTQQNLRQKSQITREGVSLLGISEAAESIGFRTVAVKTNLETIAREEAVPFIAYWRQVHFVVVYKVKGDKVFVADPAKSTIVYTVREFLEGWAETKTVDGRPSTVTTGIALLLDPTPKFYAEEDEKQRKLNFTILLKYLLSYKNLLFQLALGLLAGSVISLIFPFLTQSIVDVGINTRDVNFIDLVLMAELALFLGQTSVQFIRSWVMLHINTRINISILSDFLIKLMRLPIGFFDTKMVGDIMQRMGDHRRIQHFLTGPTLSTLFSFVNFFVFSVVIIIYDVKIFFVFLAGSALYVVWILLAGLQTLRCGFGGPEQGDPVGAGGPGDQDEQLRDHQALGVGAHPGPPVPGERKATGPLAIPTGRGNLYQPGQEYLHHLFCRPCRGQRSVDHRWNAGDPVYHRAVEQSHRAVHPVYPQHPGCDDQPGTAQ